MKKYHFILALFFAVLSLGINAQQDELSPYLKVGELEGSMDIVRTRVLNAINDNGWEIIGEYHPAENKEMAVIAFTNDALKRLSIQFKDRGALASVQKAAMIHKDGKTTVSMVNPEYMFRAYWGGQMDGKEKDLVAMSEKIKGIFSSFGELEPFGGFVETKDLPDYHYMMMMPYFDEPEELKEFASFKEGIEIVRKNLEAGKGQTVKVFEQIFEGEEIAVFGVGLWSKEDGEGHFLPTIGEAHIANLPYEIILQGKEATMLHGKYRIAIYWPELKMGTFMKINSTPGDIEDTLKSLTEDESI